MHPITVPAACVGVYAGNLHAGVDNPGNEKTGHSIVGCVAGDEDCYTTFAELFDALINKVHGHYPPTARQDIDLAVCDPAESCTEEDSFDPAYILGYEMQAKRNIAGYNLSPLCSRYYCTYIHICTYNYTVHTYTHAHILYCTYIPIYIHPHIYCTYIPS